MPWRLKWRKLPRRFQNSKYDYYQLFPYIISIIWLLLIYLSVIYWCINDIDDFLRTLSMLWLRLLSFERQKWGAGNPAKEVGGELRSRYLKYYHMIIHIYELNWLSYATITHLGCWYYYMLFCRTSFLAKRYKVVAGRFHAVKFSYTRLRGTMPVAKCHQKVWNSLKKKLWLCLSFNTRMWWSSLLR